MTTETIPVKTFCAGHRLEISFVHSLEEHGLVETVVVDETECLELSALPKLEKIVRLHRELNLNFEGIDVVHHLLDQLEIMQGEINTLRNRLLFYEEKGS